MFKNDAIAKAVRAYFRKCERLNAVPMQPSSSLSGIERRDGLEYVVLRNMSGELASFRISPRTNRLIPVSA